MVTAATQSMSRVARCIDNGPMEGFWGLMKREMYYGKKYKTKEFNEILGVLTPMEFHKQKLENGEHPKVCVNLQTDVR